MDILPAHSGKNLFDVAQHELQGHELGHTLQIQLCDEIIVITADESEYELRDKRRDRKRHHYAEEYSDYAQSVQLRRFEQRVGYALVEQLQKEYRTHAAEHPGNYDRQRRSDPADLRVKRIRNDPERPERHHRYQERDLEQFLFARKFQLSVCVCRQSRDDKPYNERNERHPHGVQKTDEQRRRAQIIGVNILREYCRVCVERDPRKPYERRRGGQLFGRCDGREKHDQHRRKQEQRINNEHGINYDPSNSRARFLFRFGQRRRIFVHVSPPSFCLGCGTAPSKLCPSRQTAPN